VNHVFLTKDAVSLRLHKIEFAEPNGRPKSILVRLSLDKLIQTSDFRLKSCMVERKCKIKLTARSKHPIRHCYPTQPRSLAFARVLTGGSTYGKSR
jgi:hypothetical protein